MALGSLEKLKRLSLPIALILTACLALFAAIRLSQIVCILFLFQGEGPWRAFANFSENGVGLSIVKTPDQAAGVSVASLAVWARIELAGLALASSMALVAIYHIRKLFFLYSRGIVFSQANVRHMKLFGAWLIASQIAANLCGRAFPAIAGIPVSGTANAAMSVVYGAMIFVVARVMQLGREADIERQEFM